MSLRKEIEEFLQELTDSEKYDEEEGVHYWYNPSGKVESGICTNGAKLIAARFNGEVKGYATNQENLVGGACFGHDFAIVGEYLVDWWAKIYEEKKAIWELNNPELETHYLPQNQWETVPLN